MIEPVAGRVVWFWPGHLSSKRIVILDPTRPFAATVAFVHHAREITISAIDHAGEAHPFFNVKLVQDDDAAPEGGRYCEWMPYQKGQAARTEQLEHAQKPSA